jgi:hypothetical protein
LADGPRSVEDLAAASGVHPHALMRLLRALASVGLFRETEPGSFGNSELSEGLRRDVPESQWAFAVMMGGDHYDSWAGLLECVRTGDSAFDSRQSMPIFEYLDRNPESAALFDEAMTAIHGRETRETVQGFDFREINVLADVGGGNGSNLEGILQYYPEMHRVLFDLPKVAARARERLRGSEVAERCQFVGGDFFVEIPVNADAYLLRHILHDWDDRRAAKILENLRTTMPIDARILVVEHVLPEGDAPSFGKLLDLNMLVVPGGLERTEREFDRLFADCGFKLTRVVPIAGDLGVVEAIPI